MWSPAAGLSSTSGSNILASPPNSITYTLLTTLPNGCSASASIDVDVWDLPPVPVLLQNGSQLQVAQPGTYDWYFDGQLIETNGDELLDITGYGQYHVVVTDANGCSQASPVLEVSNVGINQLPVSGHYQLVPNPARDYAMLQAINRPGPVQVTLLNAQGQIVRTFNQSNYRISLEGLASGVYLARFQQGSSSYVQRLVVER